MISERLVKKLRLKVSPLEREDLSVLVAADGNPIQVVGKVSISIKLGGLTIPFNLLVVH